ncbi:lipoprotein, partial [Pseudomonas syringae pv. actinidiae ICMP 19096]
MLSRVAKIAMFAIVLSSVSGCWPFWPGPGGGGPGGGGGGGGHHQGGGGGGPGFGP